jgi:glycosyltransferase involved in cell wall biosynthesis
MRDAGHDVGVFEVENPHGARTFSALAHAPWDRRGARTVVATTDAFDADVVHLHNTWFALSPAVIAEFAARGRALVMTLHNYRLMCVDGSLWRDNAICRECVGRSPLPGVVHGCYRDSRTLSTVAAATIVSARRHHVWDGVHTFIAPTDTVRNAHVDAGIDPQRIVVKPHFLTDLGARTDPPSKSRTIVFAGRLAPTKGVERLLAAWRAAAPDLGDLELLIVGDGPLREQLERDAPRGVRFAGVRPLDETREHIKHARAFAFASEWLEPFGLVLLEAMAAGTPIVGTDTGSTADIVGDAGRLAPTGSTSALAAVLRATTDDAAVDALGAAARARYVERYTPEVNRPQLEAIYRDAIDGINAIDA